MTRAKKISIQEILNLLSSLYNFLYTQQKVAFPLAKINLAKLESVVKTVEANYFGLERFPRTTQKAAVYFCLIIKSHSMVDGNKRLAVLFLEAFCQIHKIYVDLPILFNLDELAVSVAESDIDPERMYDLVEKILFN